MTLVWHSSKSFDTYECGNDRPKTAELRINSVTITYCMDVEAVLSVLLFCRVLTDWGDGSQRVRVWSADIKLEGFGRSGPDIFFSLRLFQQDLGSIFNHVKHLILPYVESMLYK